jgi:hypothetical protein
MQWTGNPSIHLAFEIIGFIAGVSLYAVQRARRGDTLPDVASFAGMAGGLCVGGCIIALIGGACGASMVGMSFH